MTTGARIIGWRGVAAVELNAPDTAATVVPGLGMLIVSLTVDGTEYIARPVGVPAYRAGHTTAVPLLYPWANRLSRRTYQAAGRKVSLQGLPLHTDANGLPIHGTMTARPDWEIESIRPGRLQARFNFGGHEDLLASFPFPHQLAITVVLARRRLRVVTEVRATGGVTVPVSFGWHPYWRLPGSRDSWMLSLPARTHSRLDRRGIPTGPVSAELPVAVALGGREFDDLYGRSGRGAFVLSSRRHRLRVDLDPGYPYAQIYAPRAQNFCCIEPMTARTNALVTGDHPIVPPGESFCASFTATIR